jgi:endoglucanase
MNRREFNQGVAATGLVISGCGGGGGSAPAAGAPGPTPPGSTPAPTPAGNAVGAVPSPAAAVPTPAPAPAVRASGPAIGTNLTGMQTAETALRISPGTRSNMDFTVARRPDVQWLAAQGFTKSRLPIQWEMLQPMLFDTRANAATRALVGEPGAFNAGYLAHIQAILDAHAAAGMRCLIDLHNYCRYRDFRYRTDGSVIGLVNPGGGAMPYSTDSNQVYTRIFATAPGATMVPAHFADFWARAARLWKDHPGFGGYGLMNEPFNMPSPGSIVENTDDHQDLFIWPAFARAAIDAIRAIDPSGPIYLNGNSWGGAFSIGSLNPAWPLAGTNLVYEVHLYMDARNTGQAFDFDTEVASNFTAGRGAVPLRLDTGVERLRIAVEWAKPRGLTLSLAECGMPVDDPRWHDMFKRTVDFARANGIEVLSWNGGNHWSHHNAGLNDVPGWHQNKTLEPEMSSVLKASAGIAAGELFDDGPGFAAAGTPVTITVWSRGNFTSPVTLAIASSNGGSLSSLTVTVPAGANRQASFSFLPAANTVTTLSYTVLSGNAAAPAPRKVYSLADPVAYAATSLADAAMAILARYGACKWAMADGYTDYLLGAPAAPGQPVRAVADSGYGSSPGNAMEMLNWMNNERDTGMAVPVMREVNGHRCTDHSAPNTSGFWCRKVLPVAGVQPNPRNRMPYGMGDPHFAIAAISVPDVSRTGLVFQASRASGSQAAELALAGSRPQARWTSDGGSVTLTAPAALAANAPAVLTLTSAPGAQRLRVNSQEVTGSNASFAASLLDQMLIAWGFVQFTQRDGFGGNVYAVVSGRGAPSSTELGVLERYLHSLAA